MMESATLEPTSIWQGLPLMRNIMWIFSQVNKVPCGLSLAWMVVLIGSWVSVLHLSEKNEVLAAGDHCLLRAEGLAWSLLVFPQAWH